MNAATNVRTMQPHPLADLMPAMSSEELTALTADIKQHGVHEPVVIFEGKILDGRHRLKACDRIGIDPPSRVFEGTTEEAKAFVLSANVHRRHLTFEQKQAVMFAELKRDPTQSDRAIAGKVKASPTSVGKLRAKAEAAGDVSTVNTRTDSKGRAQPATKPKPKAAPTKPKRPPATKAAPVVSLKELIDGYRVRIAHDHNELPDGQKQEFVQRLAAIIKLLTPEAASSAATIPDATDADVVLQ